MKKQSLGLKAIFLFWLFCIIAVSAAAENTRQLHPINKKLVQMGIMPVPKYYPEVPRITAQQAYSLYLSGKALFVLISSSNHHLIVGGLHLTEDKPPRIDPNRLPFRPGQILVAY